MEDNDRRVFTRTTQTPEETEKLAALVGQRVREGTVISLLGDLGMGKTLFVRSLAKTLGVEGEVTSPTFSLMNIYEGICPIFHFDHYRLEKAEDLEEIGFYEYVEEPLGIVLIEWADKFPEAMPEEYLTIAFAPLPDNPHGRLITFDCVGKENEELLKELDEFCQF